MWRKHLAIAVSALVCGFAATAEAQMCSTLTNPVYISGSTALEPLWKSIGVGLASRAVNPITIVYIKGRGSCEGIDDLDVATLKGKTASYIDKNFTGTTPPTCTIDTDVLLDIGASDVFYENCRGTAKPANYSDVTGPVEAMQLVGPKNASQRAITAEEAYMLFGFGSQGQVTPWSDETQLCIRSAQSGTQRMIAAAIKVPAEKWPARAIANASSGNVVTCISNQGAANPEKTLGILASDIYEQNTATLKAFAYRGYNQCKAYLPNSTETSIDKRNVREGRYTIFGYAHLITKGTVRNPTQGLLDVVSGVSLNGGYDPTVLSAIVQSAKLVPQCAMKVSRDRDGGETVRKYTATQPCGCKFEELVSGGGAPAGCTTCTGTGAGTCATGQCRYGYCEAN